MVAAVAELAQFAVLAGMALVATVTELALVA